MGRAACCVVVTTAVVLVGGAVVTTVVRGALDVEAHTPQAMQPQIQNGIEHIMMRKMIPATTPPITAAVLPAKYI